MSAVEVFADVAMAITAEELARLLNQLMVETQKEAARNTEAMVTRVVAELKKNEGDQKEERSNKNYRREFDKLETFGAKVDKWKEWSYKFVVALRAVDQKAGVMLEAVQKLDLQGNINSHAIGMQFGDEEEHVISKTKAEIFNVLSLRTTDEASGVVRGVEDMDGYVAWKRLYDKYNPRTPASLTQAWLEVVNPKRAKDLGEAGRMLDAWELKVAALEKEHGESPTTGLKAALLLKMLPESTHLTIVQGMDTKKLDFDALRTKVRLMMNVHVERITPKPMDIDETKREDGDWWQDGEYYEDTDVMAVGEACHRCGGFGHYARECGTAKGKGKDQGKGTGAGKGWGGKGKGGSADNATKGGGKGPKGGCFNCGGNHYARECPKGGGKGSKGKGITCYNCGGKGHRATQCPSSVAAVEQEEAEGEDITVDGVWRVSEVAMEDLWTSVRGRWRKKPRQAAKPLSSAAGVSGAGGRSLSNRFAVLQEYEPDCTTDHQDVEVQDHAPAKWIQEIGTDSQGKWVGTAEIVVDSAADESVCPWEWAKAFKVKEIPEEQRMRLRNASGGRIHHYGEKVINFTAGSQDDVMGMKFQVCDVQRPLAAVWRMVEKGNIVQFGPKAEDNYIYNPERNDKIALRRKGRSFVLDAEMVKLGRARDFTGQGN